MVIQAASRAARAITISLRRSGESRGSLAAPADGEEGALTSSSRALSTVTAMASLPRVQDAQMPASPGAMSLTAVADRPLGICDLHGFLL
jgi:hypothetical protein